MKVKKTYAICASLLIIGFTGTYAGSTSTHAQAATLIPLISAKAQNSTGAALRDADVELFARDASLNNTLVLHTKTDSNGVANVFYSPSESMKQYADTREGFLNFTLVISAGPNSNPCVYTFSRNVDPNSLTPKLLTNLENEHPDLFQPQGEILGQSGMHNSWAQGAANIANLASSSISSSTPMTIQPNDTTCFWTSSTVSTSRNWTIVGEVHNAHGSAVFSYGSGQHGDTTVSSALSYDGTDWSMNGSDYISNSSGLSFSAPPITSTDTGYQVDSLFNYDEEQWSNTCGLGNPYKTIDSTLWDSGMQWGANTSYADGKASQYPSNQASWPAGAKVERYTDSAATYHYGVNVFGVGLTTESGYDTSTKIDWSFSAGSILYGHDGPPSIATIIYAQ